MTLTWSRTINIGGGTKPYDFSAHDPSAGSGQARSVGRIYRNDTSGMPSHWFWTMNAFGAGIDRGRAQCSGRAETKQEAAALVEAAWLACRLD